MLPIPGRETSSLWNAIERPASSHHLWHLVVAAHSHRDHDSCLYVILHQRSPQRREACRWLLGTERELWGLLGVRTSEHILE